MKIHYLVTSLESGGAEVAIPDIVNALQHLGHKVEIIVCEPRDMLAAPHLEAAGLSYDLMSDRRRSMSVMLYRYMKRIRRSRPDVIWTSLSWATRVGQWAGRLTGIPVISFKHSAAVKPAVARMRHISKLWIGDSRIVQTYLQEEMQIPPGRVMQWPFYRCNPAAPQASAWDGQGVLQIGSVGRLHEVKNYDLLIKAVAKFLEQHPEHASHLHLTILGEGPERENLEELVRQLGLQKTVSLPGFSREVEPFLAGLHVYAQPSRFEGMCLAAHEAMNASLPVIATPVGELKYSVRDAETGFILEGEVIPAFCAVLERIFADPAALYEYGRQACAYVRQNFSHEAYAKAAAAIMQKIERDIVGSASRSGLA